MMDVAGQEEPESSSCHVFGLVAEQCGIRDAALADYHRVEKPDTEEGIATTTWDLAQRRIAALAMSK